MGIVLGMLYANSLRNKRLKRGPRHQVLHYSCCAGASSCTDSA
ncbi:MAG: hypothetical protein ACLRMJ_02790 [Alistipes finegoldii]